MPAMLAGIWRKLVLPPLEKLHLGLSRGSSWGTPVVTQWAAGSLGQDEKKAKSHKQQLPALPGKWEGCAHQAEMENGLQSFKRLWATPHRI